MLETFQGAETLISGSLRTLSNALLCGWRWRPQTQKGRVLLYHCCRLRAAVTIRPVEINGRDTMFARGAFECGAVIHGSGCLISHTFTVAPFVCPSLGQ